MNQIKAYTTAITAKKTCFLVTPTHIAQQDLKVQVTAEGNWRVLALVLERKY